MAKFLITGGCGFIGSHLAEELINKGNNVIILDDLSTGKIENKPKKAKFIKANILDKNAVKKALKDVDFCFHLAAVASIVKERENWTLCNEVNLTGTINILEVIAKSGRKIPFIYASSAAVYGENKKLPNEEGSYPSPLTGYGADKFGCELQAKIAHSIYGIPSVGLRFFNVYGPRQDPKSPYSGVISLFLDKIANNKKISIFGDGEQTRDFIYVKDIVKGLIAAKNYVRSNNKAEVFNLCTGGKSSINALVKAIESVTKNNALIEYLPKRNGDIKHSYGSTKKALKHLDFKAETNIIDGLKKTYNY